MSQPKKSQVWGGRLKAAPDQLNLGFCAGRDVRPLPMCDQELLPYDIWTNLAHLAMLTQAGVISPEERQGLHQALLELHQLAQAGQFTLDASKEDVHINVEHFLTYHKGLEGGKRIHSGRSRNDQVSTDMRLFLRQAVLDLLQGLFALIQAILDKAQAQQNAVMPGFTHYQPAMITTFGHWLTGWSQGLLRDAEALLQDFARINLSPLGAAASFGTSWPINREESARLLGFDGVEENSLDCISSRGENEARVAASLSLLMNHLASISQDLILLSLPYYGMVEIPDQYVSGSSIMPQKRNPDTCEIIRAKAAQAQGILTSLLGIQKGSMSGYNRDSQQTKYLVMDLFRECQDAPAVLAGIIQGLVVNQARMEEQCQVGFMNAADVADWLAQKFGLSFRDCYEVLSLAVKYSEEAGKLTHPALKQAIAECKLPMEISPEEVAALNQPLTMLAQKQHTGAPSPQAVAAMIQKQSQRLQALAQQANQRQAALDQAWADCQKL